MKLVTGGITFIVAFYATTLLAETTAPQIKLVFHSSDDSPTWDVKVYERRVKSGLEREFPVFGADVDALQDEKVVAHGTTNDSGTVTFGQLDPSDGDVSVRAKRSGASEWEETMHLKWRVPDARVQLSTDPSAKTEWEPCRTYTTKRIIIDNGCARVVCEQRQVCHYSPDRCVSPRTSCYRRCYYPNPAWTPVTVYYAPPASAYYCPQYVPIWWGN